MQVMSLNNVVYVCLSQAKELALAASKFTECQKTIDSLGQQLNYIATLEDFLIDSERPKEIH